MQTFAPNSEALMKGIFQIYKKNNSFRRQLVSQSCVMQRIQRGKEEKDRSGKSATARVINGPQKKNT